MHKRERSNVAFFLSGRSLSVLMSCVYSFAMGLYVLKATGSGLSFAVTLSIQIVPTVLIGPFAGVLADRFDKKILVVATDALSGALFLVLFFASSGGLTLWGIYAATLLFSLFQTLYNVSIDSAVPDIVSEQKILMLNSVGKIVDSSAAIISPSLGGVLYAVLDIRAFVLFNGIAYVLCTAAEGLIDFHLSGAPEPRTERLNLRRDFAQGVDYIKRTGWIRGSLLNFITVNFFLALCYSVPVPYILNNIFRLSPTTYGIAQCFLPIGSIAGALLVKKVTGLVPSGRLMTLAGILCSVCLFLFGALPALSAHPPLYLIVPYYGFLLACSGLIVSLIDIPFINNFQTQVPEDIRGRSLSISISAVKVFAPVGYLLSGSLIGVAPAFYPPLFGGIALGLFYLTFHKRIGG
jgi:Major Facilitator Superfamily.